MTQTSTRMPAALQDKRHANAQAAAGFQAHFGVGASTCSSRARKVRKALGMHRMAPECTLPSRLDPHPPGWRLQVNGLVVDVRRALWEKQVMALAQGSISYAPGRKESGA